MRKRYISVWHLLLVLLCSEGALANATKESLCDRNVLCHGSSEGLCGAGRVDDYEGLCGIVYDSLEFSLKSEAAKAAIGVVTIESANFLDGLNWSIQGQDLFIAGFKLVALEGLKVQVQRMLLSSDPLNFLDTLKKQSATPTDRLIASIRFMEKLFVDNILPASDGFAQWCVHRSQLQYVPGNMANKDVCHTVVKVATGLAISNAVFFYGSKTWIRNPRNAIYMVDGIVGATDSLMFIWEKNIESLMDMLETRDATARSIARGYVLDQSLVTWRIFATDNDGIETTNLQYFSNRCDTDLLAHPNKSVRNLPFQWITDTCHEAHVNWYRYYSLNRYTMLFSALAVGDIDRYNRILQVGFTPNRRSLLERFPEQLRLGNIDIDSDGLKFIGGLSDEYLQRAVSVGLSNVSAIKNSLGVVDFADTTELRDGFKVLAKEKYEQIPGLTAGQQLRKRLDAYSRYDACVSVEYGNEFPVTFDKYGVCIKEGLGRISTKEFELAVGGIVRYGFKGGIFGCSPRLGTAYLKALAGMGGCVDATYQPDHPLTELDVYALVWEVRKRMVGTVDLEDNG